MRGESETDIFPDGDLTPSVQNENIILPGLNKLMKEMNRIFSDYGWMRQELPDVTRYQKSKSHELLNIELEEIKPEGTESMHVRLFSICYDASNVRILGTGNGYCAEVYEPCGEYGYVNKRPMREYELKDLKQEFSDELCDFEKVVLPARFGFLFFPLKKAEKRARREIKEVIIEDLGTYYQDSLENLPICWERYKLRINMQGHPGNPAYHT